MNIFVVVSKNDLSNSFLEEKISSVNGVRQFILCPVHAGLEEKIDELEEFIHKNTSAQCFAVQFSRRLLDHSLKVKDDYIQWISQLGNCEVSPGVSLKKFFRYRSSEFSLWWLSLVYEKSPGKTDAFLCFAKTSLLADLVQENHCAEVWISGCKENGKYYHVLSSFSNFQTIWVGRRSSYPEWRVQFIVFIREILRVIKYVYFLLAVCCVVNRQKKPSVPEKAKCFVITMFPFFDQKKFDSKIFSTKAYGPLQEVLESQGSDSMVWLAMHTRIHPYSWKESLRLAGEVKKFKSNFFSLDDWIGFKDIVLIAFDFAGLFFKFLKILHLLPELTQFKTKDGQRMELWPVLCEDFISSFAGKEAVVNLHFLYIFKNLVKDVPKGSTIIHFAEMHGWERSLQMVAQAKGEIKVVALQHAHVPQLLLNYFDHKNDLKDENFIQSVPQPFALGSVGSVIFEYFRNQGWSKEKLFIIGGFRFLSLLGLKTIKNQIPSGKNILVAAFSICANENYEMLKMLYKAFNDGSQDIKIIIKSHPAEPVEKMALREKLFLNRNVFEFTEVSLEKIVPTAVAMFACSTSSIFYAMACRKPVIVPYLYDALDLCPLTNLYPYEMRVDNAQHLKDVMQEIVLGRFDASHHEQLWRQLSSDYLNIGHEEDEQFEILNKYL